MNAPAVHLEDILALCDSGEWGDDPVDGTGIPVLRVSDIKPGNQISFSSAPIRLLSPQKRATKTLRNGDLVVVKSSGSATNVLSGRVSAVYGVEDGQFGFANFLLRLRADERRYNAQFLLYVLSSPQVRERILSMVAGSTYPNLRVPEYRRMLIPNPPLAEQQRIVGVLDEAFAGLATAHAHAAQNLQNARALFESHLQSVFTHRGKGWVEKRLDQVCIVERGSSPRPIKEYFTTASDGVNWIKIGDTEEGGKYVFSTAQKITPEGAKQSRFVKEGDFILTNSMSFGRPYIMKTSGYIHDGWFVLRLNEGIDTDYFYYLLSSAFVQEQFHRLAAGAVVKNISGDLVKQAILPIPSPLEQNAIVTQLDALAAETQRLTRLYEQKQAALAALKKSLLHQAFTGEL